VEWRARSYTRAPRTGASPADYSTTSPAIKTCRTPPSARCRASSRPPRDARGRNGYPRRELIRDGHMARAQRLGVCDLPLASSSRGREHWTGQRRRRYGPQPGAAVESFLFPKDMVSRGRGEGLLHRYKTSLFSSFSSERIFFLILFPFPFDLSPG
jgi:hypothetical protein